MMVLTKSRLVDILGEYLAKFEVEDKTGKITWCTRALEKMFGYARQGELEGQAVEVLVPIAFREKHAAIHRPSFMANPEPRMMGRRLVDGSWMELMGQRKDGSTFPVEVMLIPCACDGINVTVGIVVDMTDRVKRDTGSFPKITSPGK